MADLGNINIGDLLKLVELIRGLLGQNKPLQLPSPSVGPLPPPYQIPGDEHIPNPTKPPVAAPPVTSRLDVVWMQLSRKRFPEAYTQDNPFGLLSDAQKRAILNGESALNFESKVRFDTTWKDKDGHEITPDDVRKLGLAWKSRWIVRDVDTGEESFLEGQGETYINDKGLEEAKVVEEGAENTRAGQGTRNYTDTLGFGQVIQFFKEGTFEVHMEIAGQSSPTARFKVS